MSSNTDVITLSNGTATCKVHLFGATVISWVCKGQEMIFVSSKSHFDNKKAIRGGIPLVFPNFGPWDLGPQHGFARIQKWKLESREGSNQAVFALEDCEETMKMWPFQFQLVYKVLLTDASLKTEFVVHNTGAEQMSFTCLLHTYCKVADVEKTTMQGLKGLTYIDKVLGGEKAREERDLVSVSEQTDRIYMDTPDEHTVTGVADGTVTLLVKKYNLPDTVVWNPWQEKAAAMADFGDQEYPHMICVEPGHVGKPVQLAAGQTYETSQTLTVA